MATVPTNPPKVKSSIAELKSQTRYLRSKNRYLEIPPRQIGTTNIEVAKYGADAAILLDYFHVSKRAPNKIALADIPVDRILEATGLEIEAFRQALELLVIKNALILIEEEGK